MCGGRCATGFFQRRQRALRSVCVTHKPSNTMGADSASCRASHLRDRYKHLQDPLSSSFFFLVLLVVWLFFLPLDSHLAVCTPDHTVKDLRELHTACQSIFSSMYRGGGKKTGRREGEWRRMAMVVVSMWEEACWPKSLEKQLARWFTKFRTNLISCYQSSRTLCSARLQLCLSFSFFFSPSFFLLNSCS